MVQRIARRYGQKISLDDAKDTFHDALEVLQRRLLQPDERATELRNDPDQSRGFLHTTVIYKVRERARNQRQRPGMVPVLPEDMPTAASSNGWGGELLRHLKHCLPSRAWTILDYTLAGYRQNEIAQRLHVSQAVVSIEMKAIRKACTEALRNLGRWL